MGGRKYFKIREVLKYLMQQKGFTAKNNIQKKEKNLENTKKIFAKFKKWMSTEYRTIISYTYSL